MSRSRSGSCGRTGRRLQPVPAALRILLAVVAALVLAAAPSSAVAAPYEVWSCRDADGNPVSASAWVTGMDWVAGDAVEDVDTCLDGGGRRVALAPERSHIRLSAVDLRFDMPRGTSIVDFELWRSTRAANALETTHSYVVALEELVGGVPAARAEDCRGLDPGGASHETCGTRPAVPLDPANHYAKAAPGALTAIRLSARCQPGNASEQWCGAVSPVAASTTLDRSRVVLDDPTPPAAEVVGGSLAAGAPVSGPATLELAGNDAESGVATLSLAVDGGEPTTISTANSLNGCRRPYTSPRPCTPDTARVFTVDAATLTPGAHEVAGTVVDAAGNSTPWGPVQFEVAVPPAAEEPPVVTPPAADPPVAAPPAAGPEPVPAPPATPTPPVVSGGAPDNGTPAVLRPRVALRIERGKAGAGPRIIGTVRTPAGRAITDARLLVHRTPLGTAPNARATTDTVRTDTRGRFVAPRRSGAHRVRVTFAPWEGAPVTRTVQRDVRTTLRLTAEGGQARRRTGQTYTLRGRVRGAGQATPDTPVQIEAIVRGRWRVVGTGRLSPSGRWTWRYRFASVTRPTRFAFRATLLSAPAWPWSTRHSARVHVRVDPR